MQFEMNEHEKAKVRNIVGTALEDESFKKRLLENPEAAIRELYPDYQGNPHKSLTIVDQSDEILTEYLNISRATYVAADGKVEDLTIQLSEEELEMVAGGWSCIFSSCNGADGNTTVKV